MKKLECEGGCGVIGLASSEKLSAKFLLPGLCQMRNRGNGKGGGIAAAGMDPSFFHVSQKILDENYIFAVAYLDVSYQKNVEKELTASKVHIDHVYTFTSPAAFPVVLYFLHPSATGETIYQLMHRINRLFYDSTGEKKAFVLSCGKDLLAFKMVGYAEDVISSFGVEHLKAHVWIGHHRYPTKGKVWHPGGAHPFAALNEVLVHNGDFSNYYSLCEYLLQKGLKPHFLTDTEVAILLFDLLHRTYNYPLEYVIEALAPTTERDFFQLPKEKQLLYKALQLSHLHRSPDGPWFFLVAQSLNQAYRLIGITDTSMLRPQVFAIQKGEVDIGFAASEKQAIDACLEALSQNDSRFWSKADSYWNARGGSHTDGGAFIFTVKEGKLFTTDKFDRPLFTNPLKPLSRPSPASSVQESIQKIDHPFSKENIRTSYKKAFYEAELARLLEEKGGPIWCYGSSPPSLNETRQLIIDAKNFPSEGEDSLARAIVHMAQKGFRQFLIYRIRGQRFIGSGLGPESDGIRLDLFGSPGDYLASGIDGAEIHVHTGAQDQIAQIMNRGTLIIHGGVGQTFLYGAKGGKTFIKGSCAGRPLINAVGSPRAVINGTCLDYLAESFMAGNPLDGGGFAILNGIRFNDEGEIEELDSVYPGNNLFSLASGGAIYIRDPKGEIEPGQLNGGKIVALTKKDWELIEPYLIENEKHFSIPLYRLLEYEGKRLDYKSAYKKICPASHRMLQEEEAWVKGVS